MNTLATDGICKHCHKDGSANFMECWVCREKYHVIECTLDPMVQTSLLKNQWPNILNKWTCITFTCPTCKEDFKTKEEAVMSSRVHLLEENSLKSNKQLEEIKELLTTVLTNQAQSADNIETQKAPGKPAEETPTLIVVEKAENEEQTDEENKALWSEVTKAAIKSKVGVKKSFTNQSGQTVLVCNNEKSKQALLPHVTKALPTGKSIHLNQDCRRYLSHLYMENTKTRSFSMCCVNRMKISEPVLIRIMHRFCSPHP